MRGVQIEQSENAFRRLENSPGLIFDIGFKLTQTSYSRSILGLIGLDWALGALIKRWQHERFLVSLYFFVVVEPFGKFWSSVVSMGL